MRSAIVANPRNPVGTVVDLRLCHTHAMVTISWLVLRPHISGVTFTYSVLWPQVVAFVPTGWMYEFKKHNDGFPIREKEQCQVRLPLSSRSIPKGIVS